MTFHELKNLISIQPWTISAKNIVLHLVKGEIRERNRKKRKGAMGRCENYFTIGTRYLSVNSLAKNLGYSSTTVSKALDFLRDLGLVEMLAGYAENANGFKRPQYPRIILKNLIRHLNLDKKQEE